MRMYDLIHKKRNGSPLSQEEIQFFVERYVSGEIPDYQVSALLMAIYFRGMTAEETGHLTMAMAASGEMADLSQIEGIKVDKHSTGGVGDKTSLVIAPIAAACGVKIAKMSGRGLGHTGGTVDKMESIPGMKTDFTRDEFLAMVQKNGIAIIGQSGNLCPADKKLYALRDVTATVDSMPLIASSIMSKKIAAGCDRILLDVKTGSGAFMKSREDAEALAREMVAIGTSVGRKTVALITDMDVPLGRNIGNSLEIQEVVETLKGRGPEDLTQVCLELAANMIYLGEKAETPEQALQIAEASVRSGAAMEKFRQMVAAQGGDVSYVEHPEKFPKAPCELEVTAEESGYLSALDAETVGLASVVLGAGRETKESSIDFSAGIVLEKKPGDQVQRGEVIARLFSSRQEKCEEGAGMLRPAIKISGEKPKLLPHILGRIED